MAIQYQLIQSRDLDDSLVEAWVAIQESQPRFDSPYFRPEFTQAVGLARDDVEIVVLKEGGRPVGFLPFQRDGRVGRPVGGKLSAFQAIVALPDVAWNPVELLAACGLKAWHFDHLLADQHECRPFHDGVGDSPYMDLSKGFDAYDAGRRDAGTNETRQILRKARRAERETGPLHLEYDTDNPLVWSKLREWKGQQYQESGLCDVLGVEWVNTTLQCIRRMKSPGFSGVLSALYSGDNLIAVHLGMRSHGVLHWWFPTFDRNFARNSPGSLMMLKFAQDCERLGIHRLDLGKGPEQYKKGWASGSISVAEGCIQAQGFPGTIRSSWVRARQWLRSSPYVRTPARWLRPIRSWWAMR